MNHRVVITGFGPVSSIGIGREEFVPGVQQGQPRSRGVEWLAGTRLEGLKYSPIDSFAVSDYLPSKLRKSAKLMSRDIQLAVASSILAMQDAGLIDDSVHDRLVGVVFPELESSVWNRARSHRPSWIAPPPGKWH